MITREKMIIPTYEVGSPEPDPIYLTVRNNQGTKGNFYPTPMINKLYDEKVDHEYDVVRLENDYIRVIVIPALGGRIYEGYDKVKDYNFIYRNRVIKPQMIGCAGAWVSGGIEFNWPQHHRPTTYLPLDSEIVVNEDGSETVWMGEYEPMFGMKGMVGITIWPDRAYVTAKGRIYNPTNDVQTFHWWANLAVHSNDDYQLQFPPDIDYITFHYKNVVSPFPVVKGSFAGANFGNGVNVSWFKNIPSPASFFIFNSSYDFMGGYDHGKKRGTVHVADHNYSVGKKFFTWGQADNGDRWHSNLTDEDGDYLEIMTGCYTDNQPDFSFLAPEETKTFEQTWYATADMPDIRNATREAAVGLHMEGSKLVLHLNPTIAAGGRLEVKFRGKTVLDKPVSLSPSAVLTEEIELGEDAAACCSEPFCPEVRIEEDDMIFGVDNTLLKDVEVNLYDEDGCVLVDYSKRPPYHEKRKTPEVHKPARKPEEIPTEEELFLEGLQLEQYRHFTLRYEDYYREGLRRDPMSAKFNGAMGRYQMRRGADKEALEHCRKAVARSIMRNPNPRDGEYYFNYATALAAAALTGGAEKTCWGRQLVPGKDFDGYDPVTEAISAFRKAAWNYNFKAPGLREASRLYCLQGSCGIRSAAGAGASARILADAARCVREGLSSNADSPDLLFLKLWLTRMAVKLQGTVSPRVLAEIAGKPDIPAAAGEALAQASCYLAGDPLAYGVAAEFVLLAGLLGRKDEAAETAELLKAMALSTHGNSFRHKLIGEYLLIGAYEDALFWGGELGDDLLTDYYLIFAADRIGDAGSADKYRKAAADKSLDVCFPYTETDRMVLTAEADGSDAVAAYLLACVYYGRENYDEAEKNLKEAIRIDPAMYRAHRLMAIHLLDHKNDSIGAEEEISIAWSGYRTSRVLLEYLIIRRKNGAPYDELLRILEDNDALVRTSEELCQLKNFLMIDSGMFEETVEFLKSRFFHPYEGGEGILTKSHIAAYVMLAKKALAAGDYAEAEKLLETAQVYPDNYHEGKHPNAREAVIFYYLAETKKAEGDEEAARGWYERAAIVPTGFGDESDYYSAMALRKLGRTAEAADILNTMLKNADNILAHDGESPYFGQFISNLPGEHSIKAANHRRAHPERYFALMGLGRKDEAEADYKAAKDWACRMVWMDEVKQSAGRE